MPSGWLETGPCGCGQEGREGSGRLPISVTVQKLLPPRGSGAAGPQQGESWTLCENLLSDMLILSKGLLQGFGASDLPFVTLVGNFLVRFRNLVLKPWEELSRPERTVLSFCGFLGGVLGFQMGECDREVAWRHLAVIRPRGKSSVACSVDGGSSPSSNSVLCIVQVSCLPQALLAPGEMRAWVLRVGAMLRFYRGADRDPES